MALSLTGLAGSVVHVVAAPYSRAMAVVEYVGRVADKTETLLDETTEAVRAARPVIDALAEAVDDGLVDEMRTGVRQLSASTALWNKVSTQVDQTLPLVDRAARAVQSAMPSFTALSTTSSEMRRAREAMEHLAGLVNATLEQLDSLPGARLVRRRTIHTP